MQINNTSYVMDHTVLNKMVQQKKNIDLGLYNSYLSARTQPKISASDKLFVTQDDLAFIKIEGVLLSSDDPMMDFMGIPYTLYTDLIKATKEIEADPNIKSVVYLINSPGGDACGVDRCADVIKSLSKPSYGYVTDICASGAYWLAAQLGTLFCTKLSQIGSLGAYTILYDCSEQFKAEGVRPILIKGSGQTYKGTGADGVMITDEELVPIQEELDTITNIFKSYTTRAAESLFTGRTWLGEESIQLGLIDKIGSIDDFIGYVRTNTNTTMVNKEVCKMSKIEDVIPEEEKDKDEEGVPVVPDDPQLAEDAVLPEDEPKEEPECAVEDEETPEEEEEEVKAKVKVVAEFKQFLTTFQDQDFAMKAFESGKSLVQAKADWFDEFSNKIPNIKKAERKGADPFNQVEAKNSFSCNPYELAAKMVAENKGMSLAKALVSVKKDNNINSDEWSRLMNVYKPGPVSEYQK